MADGSSHKTSISRTPQLVRQFSLYLENKVGRLSDVIRDLRVNNINVMALSVLDTAEAAVIRLVVDDPDKAQTVFKTQDVKVVVANLVAVQIPPEPRNIEDILRALLAAEININYIYSMHFRHNDWPVLALHTEEMEYAIQALESANLKVIFQSDISR